SFGANTPNETPPALPLCRAAAFRDGAPSIPVLPAAASRSAAAFARAARFCVGKLALSSHFYQKNMKKSKKPLDKRRPAWYSMDRN
ncbi:MAG: hypothetical protein IJU52_01405, partial [Clostridia bacterium]|nr:hypothetical protein [Clostridia bacterium]